MKLAIVDRNASDRELLYRELSQLLQQRGRRDWELEVFPGFAEFRQAWRPGGYQAVFMEILLGIPDGIALARWIRKSDRKVPLVFVTRSNCYARESYEVEALDYLGKPVNRRRLARVLDRLGLGNLRLLELPGEVRVDPEQVLYTAYSGHYFTLYLADGTETRIRSTQQRCGEKLLACPGVVTCTKGVIVNLGQAAAMEPDRFLMRNGAYVPIARRRAREIRLAWEQKNTALSV